MKKKLFFGSFIAFNLCVAQSYDLKLNLEKGKNYEVFQQVKTNMFQNMMGQEVPVHIEAGVGIRAKVLEVGKQEYQLETQFTFVSSKTESMGNKISINTQNCNQDENSKVLCSLVNKKFMVFLNHKGQVTKIENNKEILAQILKENQSENPLVKEGKIFDIYKEENIKAMFQNLFNFPLQNVKVGDTWMSNYTTKNGFELENKSKYTLVAANDKEFNINVQTNLTTTPHQKITNNGMEMIPNFTGSSNSEIILSKSSGWLIKSQSKSELKGDITVPSMNNMKIDMKSNIQSDLFPTSLPPSK